jgi:alkylhydroperoxidase family enzyme
MTTPRYVSFVETSVSLPCGGIAYGVAFHSTVLGRLGVAQDDIDRMRRGDVPTDAAAASVYSLARDIVLERGKVSDTAIAAVRAHGLSDEALLEIVAECTFASLVGVIDNLAGRVPLDEFLVPRAWK